MVLDKNCPEYLASDYETCYDCSAVYECAKFGCIHLREVFTDEDGMVLDLL